MSIYGWRGRIGVIYPPVGCLCPPEIYKMLPEGVAVYSTLAEGPPVPEDMHFETDEFGRVHPILHYIKEAKKPELEERLGRRRLKDMSECARRLAMVSDVIIYMCTTLSLVMGLGYDEEIIKLIEEGAKLPGITKPIPGLTTATAVYTAMNRMGMKKVVLVSPYFQESNEIHKVFYEAHGTQVINMKSLGLNNDQYAMAAMEPGDWYKAARTVWVPEADGVVIPCANVRSADAIECIERDLNTTVVTAFQASTWACLNKLGIKESIQGYGRLLREGLQ